MRIIFSTISVVCLFFSGAANSASLNSFDAIGMSWVSGTYTYNMSRTDVDAAFEEGGALVGYRYATLSEFFDLLDNRYAPLRDNTQDGSNAARTAVINLIDDFGFSGYSADLFESIETWFVRFGEPDNAGSLGYFAGFYIGEENDTCEDAGVLYPCAGGNLGFYYDGGQSLPSRDFSVLVRDPDYTVPNVPLPASLPMILGGLAMLSGAARFQTSKKI